MPIYDKPMIYCSLSTLMLVDIRDSLITTTPKDANQFKREIGDGSDFGVSVSNEVQPKPEGRAQAFHIGTHFVRGLSSALILRDNIFYGHGLPGLLRSANERASGATVFAYRVTDPEAFGVVEFDADGKAISIEEKPKAPKSNYAVTGLYFYDETVADRACDFKPSVRGELEITDVKRLYMYEGTMAVEIMVREFAWFDPGIHASLLDVATNVRIREEWQGLKICSPEEIAWRQGFITADRLREIAEPLRKSGYGEYMLRVLDDTVPG